MASSYTKGGMTIECLQSGIGKARSASTGFILWQSSKARIAGEYYIVAPA